MKNKVVKTSTHINQYDTDKQNLEKKIRNINKFTSETFDAKIKEKELVNKSDISNLLKILI